MAKKSEFWITNISKKNVTLADLAIVVPAGVSWNLLNSRHFHYTAEQLEKSAQEGSLYRKGNLIKVRKVAPQEPVKPGLYVADTFRETKPRSLVKIQEKRFEELDVDLDPRQAEERHAAEFAELEEKFGKESKI